MSLPFQFARPRALSIEGEVLRLRAHIERLCASPESMPPYPDIQPLDEDAVELSEVLAGRAWTDVAFDDLRVKGDLFRLRSDPVFWYYVPAFLVCALREVSSQAGDSIGSNLVFTLGVSKFHSAKELSGEISRLPPGEILAIQSFLEFARREISDASHSLAAIWRPATTYNPSVEQDLLRALITSVFGIQGDEPGSADGGFNRALALENGSAFRRQIGRSLHASLAPEAPLTLSYDVATSLDPGSYVGVLPMRRDLAALFSATEQYAIYRWLDFHGNFDATGVGGVTSGMVEYWREDS